MRLHLFGVLYNSQCWVARDGCGWRNSPAQCPSLDEQAGSIRVCLGLLCALPSMGSRFQLNQRIAIHGLKHAYSLEASCSARTLCSLLELFQQTSPPAYRCACPTKCVPPTHAEPDTRGAYSTSQMEFPSGANRCKMEHDGDKCIWGVLC